MARTVVNRFGYKITLGAHVQLIQARGGIVAGIVEKIETTGDFVKAYGSQVTLDSGISAGIDDVIVFDPARIGVSRNPSSGIRKMARINWQTFSGGTGAPRGKDESFAFYTGGLNGREMYTIDPIGNSYGRFQ